MRKLTLTLVAVLCCTMAFAQWTSDLTENTCITTGEDENYGYEMKTADNGVSYIVWWQPVGYKGYTCLSGRLQILDKDGNKLFPDTGKVISEERNQSYTVVNQMLMVDKSGNAIVALSDCRNAGTNNSAKGYTIYKFSPKGEMLWKQGVDLDNGQAYDGCAAIHFVQTADSGYVFAYESYYYDKTPTKVHVEKLNSDGTAAWDKQVVLEDDAVEYSYPYLVDAGDNQVILVYVTGSNNDFMARKLDFDGSSVWENDTKIYKGGFSENTPLWTFVGVYPAPEGGAFVTWRDDRSNSGSFANYISYIKNDGSYGFSGGAEGLKISNADGYSRWTPSLVYNKAANCVYAFYRQFNQGSQSYCGMFMQKIAMTGELMWGPEGMPVMDIQDNVEVGYPTVQNAGGSDIAVFYMTNNIAGTDTKCYAMKYDTDGKALWNSSLSFATTTSGKSSLLSSQLLDNNYWILNWSDDKEGYYDGIYAQRINIDGTTGPTTGIHEATNSATAGIRDIYDLSGKRMAVVSADQNIESVNLPQGVYISKDRETNVSSKVIVK